MKGPRTDTEKFLETVAHERCPCGHLAQRHRKAEGKIDGEVFGACRDCDCKGLISFEDEWEDE